MNTERKKQPMNLNLTPDESSALTDAINLLEEVSPNGIPMTPQCRRGLLLLKRLEGVRAALVPQPEEATPVELAVETKPAEEPAPVAAPVTPEPSAAPGAA